MRTSINKKLWLLVSIVLILGISCGIFYLFFISSNEKTTIINSITSFFQTLDHIKINYLSNHFLLIPAFIMTAFIGIGTILILFYLFYIGFLIGFIISNFIIVAGFKGFIFGLIYVLVTRLIFLFFLGILTIALIKISYYLFKSIFNKRINYKNIIAGQVKRAILAFIIILINDTFLYFLGDNLVNIFKFLVI